MHLRLTLAFLLIPVVCLSSSQAQEPETVQPPRSKTELLDGEALAEWIFFTSDSTVKKSDVCRIEDGVLRISGRPAGYLQTRRWYRDYVLEIEWRWPAGSQGGNSGVLVHTTAPLMFYGWPRSLEVQLAHGQAGDFWVIGEEVDIRVEDEDKRRARPRAGDQHSHRRIRRLGEDVERPVGEWNLLRIVCKGDQVVVEVNGKTVNHGTDCTVREGAISLQSEGAPIEFRRVTIEPLPIDSGQQPVK